MPLGVPMLAGPGAISTVMCSPLAANDGRDITVYVSIVLTAIITYFRALGGFAVERRLGQTGMRILTRLMGLVAAAIAVQFIVTDQAQFPGFPSYGLNPESGSRAPGFSITRLIVTANAMPYCTRLCAVLFRCRSLLSVFPLVSTLLIEAPVNRHFAQLHRDPQA